MEPARGAAGEQTILAKETQPARGTLWPWICLPLAAAIVVWFTVALAVQLGQGRPFGSNPMSDSGLILLAGLMYLLAAGLVFLGLFSELTLTVTGRGILIRWFPFTRRFIPLADIMSHAPVTYRPLADYGGWGLRFSFRGKGRAYSMSGNRGLLLTLTNGRKVMLGSPDPESLSRALKRAGKQPRACGD